MIISRPYMLLHIHYMLRSSWFIIPPLELKNPNISNHHGLINWQNGTFRTRDNHWLMTRSVRFYIQWRRGSRRGAAVKGQLEGSYNFCDDHGGQRRHNALTMGTQWSIATCEDIYNLLLKRSSGHNWNPNLNTFDPFNCNQNTGTTHFH